MDLRLAVYQLASANALDAQQTRQLQEVAGFQREPARLAYWLPRGVAVLGAALLGMGLICWVGTMEREGILYAQIINVRIKGRSNRDNY